MVLLDTPRFNTAVKRIVHSLQHCGFFYLSLNEPFKPEEDLDAKTIVNIMGRIMCSRGYTEKEICKFFIPLGLSLLNIQRSIRTTPEFGIEHTLELVFNKKL